MDEFEIIEAVAEVSGELTAYQIELLTTLGYIESILIFFATVALFYFSYKFFRMFF